MAQRDAPPPPAAPAAHPATLPAEEFLRQVREAHAKRSGPGGQHRNKTQTAVILHHLPTGTTAEASERRSQAENRAVALRRLRLKLALEHRTPAAARPSPLWQSRVRGRQLSIAVDHEDFPAVVAEALDRLEEHAFDMPSAAARLGITASQLLKLFRKEPAAWMAVNRLRVGHGLTALK